MNYHAIIFENVSKSYSLHPYTSGGIKNFIINLPTSLSSLRKAKYEVIRNLSFMVRKGESFGIIGRNGSGKSTTLGLIAEVIKPTKGKVTVSGRISPLLELGAGFHPDLSGMENIILNGVLLGLTKAEVLKKMDAIIDFSELHNFINQPIRIYSSGMLAKLGFSVVAHLNPEILLVDEIFSVGDVSFQNKCINKMIDFKNKGITIFLVSHAMKDIEMICDTVMWIENHEIKMIGNPREVTAAYNAIVNLT